MKLRISFSGLIGFVPSKDKKAIRVLILDGRGRHLGPDEESLFPHYPFVYFRLNDLDPASPRRPDITAKNFGLTFIDYEDLEIKGSPPAPGGSARRPAKPQRRAAALRPALKYTLTTTPPETRFPVPSLLEPAPATACGPRDLHWVMPITGIFGPQPAPVSLSVQDLCFASPYEVDPKSSANLLAGRMRFTTGELYPVDFRRTSIAGEHLNQLVRFGVPESSGSLVETWKGAIATKVVYDLDLPQSTSVSLVSQAFQIGSTQGRPSSPELRFKARKEAYDIVELTLWNAPFSDILTLLADPKDRPEWEYPQGDRSLVSFFRLCKKLPQRLPEVFADKEPKVIRACGYQADYTAEKNVGCPTCLYEEHELA